MGDQVLTLVSRCIVRVESDPGQNVAFKRRPGGFFHLSSFSVFSYFELDIAWSIPLLSLSLSLPVRFRVFFPFLVVPELSISGAFSSLPLMMLCFFFFFYDSIRESPWQDQDQIFLSFFLFVTLCTRKISTCFRWDLLVLQLNQLDSDLQRLDRMCFDFLDQDSDRGFGHFFCYIVFIMIHVTEVFYISNDVSYTER